MKRNSLQTCHGLIVASLMFWPSWTVAKGGTTPSGSPPSARKYKQVISDLTEMRDQTLSSKKVALDLGIGRQSVDAEKAFARAAQAFTEQKWLYVIQDLQQYLNLTQKPDPEMWMRGQYMLGRAYEERGQVPKSTRAYLRYLSTFVTTKNPRFDELTDVLERLVKNSTKNSRSTQTQLREFLSSIAAMDVPDALQSELKYMCAIGGTNIGQRNLAMTWLNELSKDESDPKTRQRAIYFNALLALQDKRWDDAETTLLTLLGIDGISESTRDNARLALARLYLQMKKPETALKIYANIKPTSAAYRDALFEKTFALIRHGEEKSAKTYADEYLKLFPDHHDAMQIRVIASWLELRSGDLVAAKTSIETTNKYLEELRAKVVTHFQGQTSISHQSAVGLLEITKGQVPTPSELDDILNMFSELEDMDSRLSDVDGQLRNLLYTIAKSDLDHYRPSVTNRQNQLEGLVQRALDSGKSLSSLESSRLDTVLSKIDKQKVVASQARREMLSSRASKLAREAKRWITWQRPAEELADLSRLWNKSEALRLSLNRGPATGMDPQFDELTKNIDATRRDMLSTLTNIRREQAANLVQQSTLNGLIYVLEQYASSLQEEQTILTSYEPDHGQTLDVLDDQDSLTSWNLWTEVTTVLHQDLNELKQRSEAELKNTLKNIDTRMTQRNQLAQRIAEIRDILEKRAGSSIGPLIAHFDHALSQRIARQQKWGGDLEYFTYAKLTNEQDDLHQKNALELQILTDHLRDMEQGALTQWPR